MNLIINAAEAVGDGPGLVTVRTGICNLTPADRQFWLYTGQTLSPGCYVTLRVQDDGPGMDPEMLPRIFDPFFTTKFTGRGLGLAAVLGIVKGHRGGLHVESAPGAGTTFHLVFPASGPEESAAYSAAEIPSAPLVSRSLPKILVIDDEEPVREAVSDILESSGVEVLAAADGAAGVALYRERASTIALVLLDLSMPGLGGEETFRQLRVLYPQVRILLSSGYDESEVVARFTDQGLVGFVQKPYTAAILTDAIRRHLAAGEGPQPG